MNIYVGNISYEASENDLRQIFEAFGKVESAKIISDNYTGRSKGFGFIEMPDGAEGQAAINGLNGTDFKGRQLNVNEARPPRSDRRRGGGGGRQGGPRRRY